MTFYIYFIRILAFMNVLNHSLQKHTKKPTELTALLSLFTFVRCHYSILLRL